MAYFNVIPLCFHGEAGESLEKTQGSRLHDRESNTEPPESNIKIINSCKNSAAKITSTSTNLVTNIFYAENSHCRQWNTSQVVLFLLSG
jgi:hypothetical protein